MANQSIDFNNDRKFGVEIEFTNNVRSELIAKMQEYGLTVRQESLNHRTSTGWKLVTDCSCGYELVSPPLKGEAGIEELRLACKALEEVGAHVNVSCGLHVHHDANDMTRMELRNLFLLFVRFERVLDRLVAPSRRTGGNGYCISHGGQHSDRERILSQAAASNSGLDLFRTVNMDNRYHKLNFMCYERQGTVEFRAHGGTIEFEKIEAWICLTQLFVERSKDSRSVSSKGKATFQNMKNTMGWHAASRLSNETSKRSIKYMGKRFRHFVKKENLQITASTEL